MIGAVVLAAGCSQRMGRPKMILPWGGTTVIGQVVRVLIASGLENVIVVTGGAQDEVNIALNDLPVKTIHNQEYANGEMARTLQVGLSAFDDDIQAALVVLGDQPQIEQAVIESVVLAYEQGNRFVVPSYQMRRGHPWLVARAMWHELNKIRSPKTLRNFMGKHASDIHYVNVDRPSVIQDLDTPADYQRFRPV